jgi:hypothetical protein
MADSKAAVVDGAYSLAAASFLIILIRTLLRRLKHQSFKPDDYLMLIAIVLFAVNTAAYPLAVSRLDRCLLHRQSH